MVETKPAELARIYLTKIWDGLGIEAIGVERADIKKILEAYQKCQPPFGSGKKKSEFPDAFALSALEIYARENDIKILAISGDGDWQRFGEQSKYIDVVDGLPKVFQKLCIDKPQIINEKVCNLLFGWGGWI